MTHRALAVCVALCAALAGCCGAEDPRGTADAGADAASARTGDAEAPKAQAAVERDPVEVAREVQVDVRALDPDASPTPPPFTPMCADDQKDACRRGCEAGELEACVRYGLAQRSFFDKARARASVDALERACTGGVLEACYHVAELWRAGHGVPKRHERAARVLAGTCAQGYAQACASLGAMASKGEGMPASPVQGLRLSAWACQQGVLRACDRAATLLAQGAPPDVAADPEASLAYRRLACAHGTQSACFTLASTLERLPDATPAQLDEAAAAYGRLCEADKAIGCVRQGRMIGLGQGAAPADVKRGLALFWRGCNAMHPTCAEGVPLLEAACRGGHAETCSDLGLLLWHGKGVDEDLTKAVAYFKQACDGGVAQGCTNLGAAFARGRGVETDAAIAARHFRKGCDGDDPQGCANLGLVLYRGQGVRADKRRARALWRSGCEAGHKVACTLERADREGAL